MTVTLAYVFTIFMLTLGPLKVIPVFAGLVRDATRAQIVALALRSTLQATAVALLIAFGITALQSSWGVSLDAIRITGGVLLFMAAAGGQLQLPATVPPPAPPVLDAAAIVRLSFMPLTIPVIITPWGLVAILLFMRLAADDTARTAGILAILLLVMGLNFVGMLFARKILKAVGPATFQLTGWIFAILQCGLAVETILIALRNLRVVT
jgi:multiple antibiotic resistance protein